MAEEIGGIQVDPRVEWAMKIMDTEGHEFQTEYEKLMAPVGLGITPAISIIVKNFINRIPIKTNWMFGAGLFPVGFYAGLLLRKYQFNRNQEQNATIKHYILTHPERFPEPKRTKYIDLIQPWVPKRK